MKDLNGNDIRCYAVGKVCYTEREAGIVINESRKHHYGCNNKRRSKNIPKRKYFCQDCGHYHVTHYSFFADIGHESHRKRYGYIF